MLLALCVFPALISSWAPSAVGKNTKNPIFRRFFFILPSPPQFCRSAQCLRDRVTGNHYPGLRVWKREQLEFLRTRTNAAAAHVCQGLRPCVWRSGLVLIPKKCHVFDHKVKHLSFVLRFGLSGFSLRCARDKIRNWVFMCRQWGPHPNSLNKKVKHSFVTLLWLYRKPAGEQVRPRFQYCTVFQFQSANICHFVCPCVRPHIF